ncbi:MAG: glutathione transferase GstA [Bdellovibrio sp.]|jgi:glutathione S-transferase
MKLYIRPGACSLASHISLIEAGLRFETETVSTKDGGAKLTAKGTNFLTLNAKGYVPALETQTGEILTEGQAILQYIADRAPEKGLAPAHGTFERYKLQEWLTFIGTELHKGVTPLWYPATSESYRATVLDNVSKRLDWVSSQLQGRPFLMGQTFTVADAYLFTVLSWNKMLNLDLTKWPTLMGYMERVQNRPAVHQALKSEGLLK